MLQWGTRFVTQGSIQDIRHLEESMKQGKVAVWYVGLQEISFTLEYLGGFVHNTTAYIHRIYQHLILEQVKVGPQSVGYRLEREGLVFGGSTLTSSDIAVAAGLTDMGQADRLKDHHLPPELVNAAIDKIYNIVEEAIDSVKVKKNMLLGHHFNVFHDKELYIKSLNVKVIHTRYISEYMRIKCQGHQMIKCGQNVV